MSPEMSRSTLYGGINPYSEPDLGNPPPLLLPSAGGLDRLAGPPTPEQDGLGLATPEPPKPTASPGHDWNRFFLGLEAGGAGVTGSEPLFIKLRQLDEQASIRREMVAQRMAMVEESKRQHDLQMIEKLMSAGNADALEQYGKMNPSSPATLIAQSINKKNYADVVTGVKEGLLPPEVMQSLMNPDPAKRPTSTQLQAWAEGIVNFKKGQAQEDVKDYHYRKALEAAHPNAYQQKLIEERQAALAAKQASATLDEERANEIRRGVPKATELMGHDREAFTKQLYARKYGPQVTFSRITPDEQAHVHDAVASFLGQQAGQRTAGNQAALGDVTVGQLGKAQEYRDPVTGKAAPAWAKQSDLQRLGFVNIEAPQTAIVNQLQVSHQLLRDIETAGSSLLRKSGGKTWAEIPKGMLQTPVVSLITKYAGDPNAAVLQSAIGRLAPTIARLAGDVGNISDAAVDLYSKATFTPSDTLESFSAKLKSIRDANTLIQSSMGFLPDEQSYIRQLVIRGLPDKQIEAMVDERKRYQ